MRSAWLCLFADDMFVCSTRESPQAQGALSINQEHENELGMLSVECVAFLFQHKQQKEGRELFIQTYDRNSEGTRWTE